MDQHADPGVDQIGINLLRIVTGTFFMGVALEFVDGFDPAVLFRPIPDAAISEALGAITLLALAIWFMLGAALRLAALSLALFVLASSFTWNFVTGPVEDLSAFWYDLTLCCGVLLSYLTLDARRIRRASVFSHQARMSRIAAQRRVRPRRVAPGGDTSDKSTKPARNARPDPGDEINIFADIRG